MKQRGITLIELVIVMIAMAAGLALIGSAFIEPARSVIDNQNIQQAWQVAQGCADFTLGQARQPGQFSNVTVGMADPCPAAPARATRTFTVAAMAAGTEPCFGVAWTCRKVTITVSVGSYTASVNFMLVDS